MALLSALDGPLLRTMKIQNDYEFLPHLQYSVHNTYIELQSLVHSMHPHVM